ncbi:hypothetical protein VB773_05785 [Haloarculaceae archaeon H-GB2-1]|nr:hypothetical protein [Haloarculaceae archaeon H-GB1-1]MEA5389076.1 hypothetical protein [Haloarculaceae archaeon H-GB11]MEA5407137.1 hypothetical protein [Haloarculaceae archaeon H-GB2-1]
MLDRVLVNVTVTVLVAGLLLAGIGALGLSGSLLVVLALAALSGGSFVLARRLDGSLPWLAGDEHLLWAVPTLATVVVLVWFEATSGELKTLGGVMGLLAMANYFLRPVYHVVVDGTRWVQTR